MDPNQVMNNLRKVGDVLEIDTVKPGLKCLQALVSTGKGMADECVRAAEDDDDADGAGSGSGSRGRGAEGAAIREEAAALIETMERSVKQASQAVAQAMLCQRAIQELHGKGVVYLTSLQDIPNDADDEAVAQAVVQRKATLALQHDAGEWLEEKVRAFPGSDQLKRLLGRNPLKRALDDFAFKVKGEDKAIDDDIAVVNNESEASLVCPLTRKTFSDPVRTPCGHTFEREGMIGLFKQARTQGIKCPTCNNFVGSMSSLVEDKEVKAEVRRRAAGRAKKRRRE